jgi:hypothetical protein
MVQLSFMIQNILNLQNSSIIQPNKWIVATNCLLIYVIEKIAHKRFSNFHLASFGFASITIAAAVSVVYLQLPLLNVALSAALSIMISTALKLTVYILTTLKTKWQLNKTTHLTIDGDFSPTDWNNIAKKYPNLENLTVRGELFTCLIRLLS